MSTPSLFELTKNLAALEELLDREEDGDEINRMVVESLTIRSQLNEKVEAYAGLIGELEALALARKQEADRLSRLTKSTQARADRLRKALMDGLKTCGVSKVKTLRYDVSIRKNGGKAPLIITEENIIPDEWKKTQTIVEIDKEKIRTALEGGELLDFAQLAERGESLVIK